MRTDFIGCRDCGWWGPTASLKPHSVNPESLKALWGNGLWNEDEAYDSVIQFKDWDANKMMKLLGFPVLKGQNMEETQA